MTLKNNTESVRSWSSPSAYLESQYILRLAYLKHLHSCQSYIFSIIELLSWRSNKVWSYPSIVLKTRHISRFHSKNSRCSHHFVRINFDLEDGSFEKDLNVPASTIGIATLASTIFFPELENWLPFVNHPTMNIFALFRTIHLLHIIDHITFLASSRLLQAVRNILHFSKKMSFIFSPLAVFYYLFITIVVTLLRDYTILAHFSSLVKVN